MVAVLQPATSSNSNPITDANGVLRDAVDDARWFVTDYMGGALWAMSDEQLRASLGDAEVLRSVLATAEAEVFAELERRTSAFDAETDLRRTQRVSNRRASRRASTSRHIASHEPTRDALACGSITAEHADALCDAENEHEGAAGDLIEKATQQGPDRFRDTVRRHCRERDGDEGASAAQKQFNRRSGKVFTKDDGMGVHTFELDPESNEAGIRALAYWIRRLKDLPPPPGAPESSVHDDIALIKASGRQLMADAYIAMGNASLQAGLNGAWAAPAARLLVMADYSVITQTLTGRLPDGTSLAPATIRRIACDAEILPGVFGGASEPLDLGLEFRLVSPAQRSALEARDRGCRGCGAHPAFCQAHHIVHWADFGPTNLENLVLLCSKCHHLVHEGNHRVDRLADGEFGLVRNTTPTGNPRYDVIAEYEAQLEMHRPRPATSIDPESVRATALIGDAEHWWDTPESHEAGHCCRRQPSGDDDGDGRPRADR